MSPYWMPHVLLALLLCAGNGHASTQDGAAALPPSPAQAVAQAVPVAIPDGTPIHVEIAESLDSAAHKRGDMFRLTLVDPIVIDGREIVPAGTAGTGQITHAAPARGGGAPGELLIAARSLETANGTVPLRGFKLGASGDDNSGMALGVSAAIGPFAMFIRGREIVIPAGTRGIAKVKATAGPPSTTPPAPDPPAQSMEQ